MITIIGTALVAGLIALALTGWMRKIAKVESGWLRYYLHVVLGAGAGAGAAAMTDNWIELVGFTLLGVGCSLLVVVDLAAMRLPNVMVGPLYLVLLGTLGIATILNGDPMRLLKAVGCGVAMLVLYLVMSLTRLGQFGMGDVKFGGVLGLFLGWLGWGEVLLGMFAAFALSAVVGLIMVWYRKLTVKHLLPFGPFMVAGAAIGAAAGSGFLAIA